MCKKISVVINTYNAEQYLRMVLDHLKGFDEIVVCDMESTDTTRAIAEEYGCKIVTFPKGTHRICEPARDFAIHSATNEWVLVVDADEIVPSTLRDYLYEKINSGNFEGALALPRINTFMDEPFKEKTDYQIRFFQKDKAKWPETIHSHPIIDGTIYKVSAKEELSLFHLDNPTLTQRISKINTYTDYDKERRKGKKFNTAKMLFRPFWFFLKSYLLQGGVRHGKKGIINAYLSSTYQMFLMAKVIEEQNATEAFDYKRELKNVAQKNVL